MFQFNERLNFLGRSGTHMFPEFKNLKVAFLSGLDAEIHGEQVSEELEGYSAHYFVQKDIEKMCKENKVDILLTC